MPHSKRLTAVLALTLWVLAPSGARGADPLVEPKSAQQFERDPVVAGTRFVCLGAAVRKKLFFRVYAIDFCVEAEAGRAEVSRYLAGPGGAQHTGKQGEELARSLRDDPEFFRHLMEMPVEKRAELVFLRDIDRGRLGEAFTWSLLQALGEEARPRVEAFVSKLAVRDVREGEKLCLHTRPDGQVSATLDQDLGVRDEKLATALWRAYLGPDSVTPALKDSVAAGAALLAAR
ncbi:MAG: hypothetical protein QM765_53150 [Myxococcales bacterium]